MHANQRTADINSGSGTHFLHQNRMFKRLPAVGCPAAARMGLRHSVHLFITILFGSFLLDDNGAIQVFAALGRQIDALRFEHRQNTRQHSRSGFHAAVLANMPANDLAGRAADHKNIPGAQVCSRQQFFRCLACLRRNGGAIRFLNGVLFHNLPTFFIY